MKKNVKKIVAIGTGVAVLCGSIGMSAFAITSKDKETKTDDTQTTTTTEESSSKTATGDKLVKEESVYVIAEADGSVDKVIVSNWIQNGTKASTINDQTSLKDIKNQKGDETYTLNGETCVWDAKGNDIYYQGTTDKALPVDMKVTYFLDDKQISAKDLAGKSGKVRIRYDYTNNQTETVNIAGKNETIYVPFAMMTGLVLDNDNFQNIKVTNGKVVNEGENTIVSGIAFPGLKSDLNLSSDLGIDIPEYVEVTADVKSFELDNTVTIASNSLFDDIKTDKLDQQKINEGLDKLTDGMSKLLDGSSQLYDGLSQLLEKSNTLVTGIETLAKGAESLKAGAVTADNGVAELQAGLKQVDDGLGQLEGNSANLNAGLDTIMSGIFEAYTAQINSSISALGVSIPTLNKDNYVTKINGAIAAADAIPDPTLKATTIAGLTGAREQLTGAITFYNNSAALKTGIKNYTDGVAAAKAGTDKLVAGAAELKAGTAKLAAGASQLYDGVMQIEEKSPELLAGVTALRDGSMQLSDGLKEFDKEGVSKLKELVDGNVGNIVDRINATVKAAKNYKSYSGISDGMDGTTKFIYKTAEIKK